MLVSNHKSVHGILSLFPNWAAYICFVNYVPDRQLRITMHHFAHLHLQLRELSSPRPWALPSLSPCALQDWRLTMTMTTYHLAHLHLQESWPALPLSPFPPLSLSSLHVSPSSVLSKIGHWSRLGRVGGWDPGVLPTTNLPSSSFWSWWIWSWWLWWW